MAEPIPPGFITEGAAVVVNIGGTLYPGKATGSGAPGETLSGATFEPDPSGDMPGAPFTITTIPSTPGNVALATASATSITRSNAFYSTGVSDKTPLTLTAWGLPVSGLWTYNPATDTLTISTNQARTQRGHQVVPAKPANWVIDVTDDSGNPATFDVYARGTTSDYPVLPDITVGSTGSGLRQIVTIDLLSLSFPGDGTGLSLQLAISTKGGGGAQQTYTIHGHHLEYV